VTGIGRLTNFRAKDASQAGFNITVDTPERVCVRLTVSTGACELSNSGEGVVSRLRDILVSLKLVTRAFLGKGLKS
jgi:hypothetical protein